jgi:hypothetical protein
LNAKEMAKRYDAQREKFHARDVSYCGWSGAVATIRPSIDNF